MNNSGFIAGDIVTCINAQHNDDVTVGNDYKVLTVSAVGIRTINNKGVEQGFFNSRFELKTSTLPLPVESYTVAEDKDGVTLLIVKFTGDAATKRKAIETVVDLFYKKG